MTSRQEVLRNKLLEGASLFKSIEALRLYIRENEKIASGTHDQKLLGLIRERNIFNTSSDTLSLTITQFPFTSTFFSFPSIALIFEQTKYFLFLSRNISFLGFLLFKNSIYKFFCIKLHQVFSRFTNTDISNAKIIII